MTFGNNGRFSIRKPTTEDLNEIKMLADQHKEELGFVLRPALEKAIVDQEIFVAEIDDRVVGFVHYHHRRDQQTTLYHIAVDEPYRRLGIGQALLTALGDEAYSLNKALVLLRCPQNLPANHFYGKSGFTLLRVENGKRRALNVWSFLITTKGTSNDDQSM